MEKTKTIKEPLFHIVKRAEMPLYKAIIVRAAAIVIGLLLCTMVYGICFKANPFEVIYELFNGCFGSKLRIGTFLRSLVLLLGVALALLPAFKMKFWNLGGNGQILVGALAAVAVMRSGIAVPYNNELSAWSNMVAGLPANLLMAVVAITAGAVWAIIPAVFKALWNTNESLFTLMMNYIATGLVTFFISIWVDGGSGVLGSIKTGRFPKIGGGSIDFLPIIIIAVITVFMIIYIKYSKHGYELTVVGESENTAKYIGINCKKVTIRTLALSGAICGLVGLLLAGSVNYSVSATTAENMGFTAIMVAWLAKFNPAIMIASAFFVTFLSRGSNWVNSSIGLADNTISEFVLGIIYFCVIGCEFFITYQIKFRKGLFRKKNDKQDASKITAKGEN